MNPTRTFDHKLKTLLKDRINPTLLIPCLELLEETLIDFQGQVMADKETPSEKKGDIATILTPMLKSVRATKAQCQSLRDKPEPQASRQLHNDHLR